MALSAELAVRTGFKTGAFKAQRSYLFAPVAEARRCSVVITDKETGAAPVDLVQELAPAE